MRWTRYRKLELVNRFRRGEDVEPALKANLISPEEFAAWLALSASSGVDGLRADRLQQRTKWV